MKRKIAVLLAAVLLGIAVMPGVLASADEVEISAPSAVLMEASTGKVLFEKKLARSAALCFYHKGDDLMSHFRRH